MIDLKFADTPENVLSAFNGRCNGQVFQWRVQWARRPAEECGYYYCRLEGIILIRPVKKTGSSGESVQGLSRPSRWAWWTERTVCSSTSASSSAATSTQYASCDPLTAVTSTGETVRACPPHLRKSQYRTFSSRSTPKLRRLLDGDFGAHILCLAYSGLCLVGPAHLLYPGAIHVSSVDLSGGIFVQSFILSV